MSSSAQQPTESQPMDTQQPPQEVPAATNGDEDAPRVARSAWVVPTIPSLDESSESNSETDSDGSMADIENPSYRAYKTRKLSLKVRAAENREFMATVARSIKEDEVRQAQLHVGVLCRELSDFISAEKKAKASKKKKNQRFFIEIFF